jgi:hypothetical protein
MQSDDAITAFMLDKDLIKKRVYLQKNPQRTNTLNCLSALPFLKDSAIRPARNSPNRHR